MEKGRTRLFWLLQLLAISLLLIRIDIGPIFADNGQYKAWTSSDKEIHLSDAGVTDPKQGHLVYRLGDGHDEEICSFDSPQKAHYLKIAEDKSGYSKEKLQGLKTVLYNSKERFKEVSEERNYQKLQQLAIQSILENQIVKEDDLDDKEKDLLKRLTGESPGALKAPSQLELVLYARADGKDNHPSLVEPLLIDSKTKKPVDANHKSPVYAKKVWDLSAENGDTSQIELQHMTANGDWATAPVANAKQSVTFDEDGASAPKVENGEYADVISWQDLPGYPSDYRVVETTKANTTVHSSDEQGTLESPYRLEEKRDIVNFADVATPRSFRSVAQAEGKGKFTLKKIDKDKKPLPGAEFILSNKDGSYIKSMTSNKDSKGIEFDKIPEGEYTLKEKNPPQGYKLFEDYYQIKVNEYGIITHTYVRANSLPSPKPLPGGPSKPKPSLPKKLKTENVVIVKNYSLKTTGGHKYKDNKIPSVWATSGDFIVLDFELEVKEGTNPGDSFKINLDSRISPTGIREKFLPPIPLKAKDGSIVATGQYNESDNSFTYTFTDYVRTHNHVTVKANYKMGPELKKVLNSGVYEFKNIIDNNEQTPITLHVDYGATQFIEDGWWARNKGFKMRHQVSYVDRYNGLATSVIYLNSGENFRVKSTAFKQYLLIESLSSKVEIESIQGYFVPDSKKSQYMADSMSGNVEGLQELSKFYSNSDVQSKRFTIDGSDYYDEEKRGNYGGLLFIVHQKLIDKKAMVHTRSNWGYGNRQPSLAPAASSVDNKGQSSGRGELVHPTISVINEKEDRFSINIRKQDAQNPKKGLVATFKLYNEDATKAIEGKEGKTDKNSNILSFNDLPVGKYTLREEEPPVGYQKIGDIKFEIKEDGKTTLLDNNPLVVLQNNGEGKDKTIELIVKNQKYFNLKILKRDGRNEKEGLTATFGLYKSDNKDELVKDSTGKEHTGKTDKNGNSLEFKDIKPGTYILKEITPPDGYQKVPDMTFEIEADGTVKPNNVNDSFVTFGKVDKDTAQIEITVKNFKKGEYPKTGGMGRTVFTLVGVSVMAGALAMMLRRRAVRH
ncbi:SpaA isopeptide-forming pilin-related protein [Streptococcus phocae subsp. salmonis]|uniref:SpaA isopeptide-forming pilin-related protein n=1 Tax=Streptococcus phocae TaxID=119224 RepID=UPI001F444593|nr:SpaA isopeptide-forming pilin-related protein [Streptococcus phocae]